MLNYHSIVTKHVNNLILLDNTRLFIYTQVSIVDVVILITQNLNEYKERKAHNQKTWGTKYSSKKTSFSVVS